MIVHIENQSINLKLNILNYNLSIPTENDICNNKFGSNGGAVSFVLVSKVCPLGNTILKYKLSFGLNLTVCIPSARILINLDIKGVGVTVIEHFHNALFDAGLLNIMLVYFLVHTQPTHF